MRPAVYRLARSLGLRGEVANEGGQVVIRVWGTAEQLARFRRQLSDHLPFRARIERIETAALEGAPPPDFRIAPGRSAPVTSVPPDVAVCGDCLDEVLDPGNRRYRYPFTHCAQCGPRFSIIEKLPYDRGHTSLARFPLCLSCQGEYHDPANRRFHAEAIACPECGPRIWTFPETQADPIAQAVAWLRQGKILAVKGVGGFQLLVDASNTEAVARRRRRKHRPHKPLALMARDLDVVRRYAEVGEQEARALQGPEAPVVLLQARESQPLPAAIAPGLDRLGFILPYTSLHHLLLAGFDTPLVFTSANVSGAPLCADNQEALEQLAGLADGFLLHDRDIIHRCDDSVLRLSADRIRVLRRARGFAPTVLPLPPGFESCDGVLALGGELKAVFCLLHQGGAVLSQHLGDLADARTFAWFQEELAGYRALFGFRPRHVAVDAHPDYVSGKWGRHWAKREDLRLTEVQHHHAHLAACLGEHRYPLDAGPVLGLILDGLGRGPDGTFWGGELLCGGYRHCRHLARLRPAPLPGGAKAVIEPWRNLVARLWQAGVNMERFPVLDELPVTGLMAMLRREINCPMASSAGRLFDAVAAALDVCAARQSYEGQAAMELEALAGQSEDTGAYGF
ncbi:MAG TPA: carbamoyltransferase HypF, partial [Sedimenticola sp.]|nr:carbamoyltransferase HypF [Sedimenticola sp.]